MPPVLRKPLPDSSFTLNPSAIASLFGGKEVVSAMATIHLHKHQKWLGWYNCPGRYIIAKRVGRMGNSRLSRGLFPGSNDPPAITFGLDGRRGPRYTALFSGETVQTGHLGYLTIEKSKSTKTNTTKIDGRDMDPVYVSYLPVTAVNFEAPVELQPLKDALLAIIPIVYSIVACVLSALAYDWHIFSLILLGIISNGLINIFVGQGILILKSVSNTVEGSSPGHGVLMGENEVVVVKGREEDINAITRGRFDLEIDSQPSDVPSYHGIECCCLLLLVESLLQLLLIPQASLFGQIMFLSSLGVSWVFNLYLSSLDKEKIQTKIFFKKLGNPQMVRFRAGTRMTMAVLVCLFLFHGVDVPEEKKRGLHAEALRSCLPDGMEVVRKRWIDKVVDQLLHLPDSEPASFPHLEEDEGDWALSERDRKLLNQWLDDARSAIKGYYAARNELPDDSSHYDIN